MKQIYGIILLILLTSAASATHIDIYYPNNNTTTDMYYATNAGYNHTLNNSLYEDQLSTVIIKNQPIVDDLINNPSKLANMKYIGLLFFIMLFGTIIIALVKVFK